MPDIPVHFEDVYRTHYKMLRTAAANIVRDKDASHDIVQEVFIKLYHRKGELSEIGNLKAYLYRSVVNTSITYIHNNKNKLRYIDINAESHQGSDSKLMMKELEQRISMAIEDLPPKCRAIFVLSRYDELKNKEIAHTLGLSIKTVENQMGIALKKMRDSLKQYVGKTWLIPSLVILASLFTI